MGFFFRSENSKIMKISPFSVGETSIALGTNSSTSALRAKAKHTGDWSCTTQKNERCYRILMLHSSRETWGASGLLTPLGTWL